MIRRPVAWVVAVVLFVEALGVAMLNWIMGNLVDAQNMSLAGLDPDAMSMSSKIGGIVFGLYFALCALVALLVAVRDRQPAGLGRVLLISAAVVHGLLGAVAWALIGRPQFLFMIVMLGLIVLLLVTYDRRPGPVAAEPHDREGPGGSESAEHPEAPQDSDSTPLTPPPAPTTP
ncbi:FtsH-binding integral membrane protein [Streptomyces sp. SAI-135]|nr:FtsH-binding integral membrane protein [Streptomyces sp. SAI-090]MDH6619041.1 FtsH-binding integral membrane protein [Streptomyces sp. SAI-135]